MTLSFPAFNGPDDLGRVFQSGLEEVLGSPASRTVIDQACFSPHLQNASHLQAVVFSFKDSPSLEVSLQTCFGAMAGRGLAVRAGRAAFNYLLRDFGPSLGITCLDFRLKPLGQRLRTGSMQLADLFNRQGGQPIGFEGMEEGINWRLETKPGQPGISSCHLLGGLLQESLTWMSSGRNYVMEEATCIYRGDPLCSLHFRPYLTH